MPEMATAQTSARDQALQKPHPRPERRRVLGDLSNTVQNGGCPEKRVLGDVSNTQRDGRCEKRIGGPKQSSSRGFKVFTGGENEADEVKSTTKSQLEELGLEELPELDWIPEPPTSSEKYWKPIWEGGPADPEVLAQGLAETMDWADLEAQRMDALMREEWAQTPPRRQVSELDLPLPSPPSISPFRPSMDVDSP